MFSYGFQPWAALTGQQILEAIDEPNFQVVLALNIFILIFLYYAFFYISEIRAARLLP